MKTTQNFINEVQLEFQKKLFSKKRITSSSSAAALSWEIYRKTHARIELKEYIFIIMLNRANDVLGYVKLGEGGISGAVVDIRLAFATAIKCLASGIILVHNHPSANLKPSSADKCITEKFIDAGKILDIQILDHIILSKEGYYSFADAGML